jgi:peptide chain release factor subunit 1
MTATPITTKPGPEQAKLRELLRRLAEVTSTEAPIISTYVGVAPASRGERPAERVESRVVRDRLRTIGDSLEPHSPAGTSFAADRERIEGYLKDEDFSGVAGVAIFACEHIGLWETISAGVELETSVAAGPTAELFELARLLDESVAAVVAVVDSNTCRLFVTRRGRLQEVPGPDEPPDEHKRHEQGGWSQARYQRHVDMQDKRFAKEAATAIQRLVEREHAQHVILAGEDRSISVLDGELPEVLRPLVEYVAHIEIRASRDEVREEVWPILAALEQADGQDAADRAIGGARSGGLGVAGLDDTMKALEFGQVDELVLDETAPIDENLRAELVRQAVLTDAGVEIVPGHDGLRRFDGVGATLRFRVVG